MRMTRSACSAASRSAAVIRSGSSGTMSVTDATQPASRAWAASMRELVSGISPGRELGADGPDLVAGRHDDDRRLPAYLKRR